MNDKTKPVIFANPVRDLTIARYLAAMDVDYFGIDLDDADIQKTNLLIQQIREWVQGPELIGVSKVVSGNKTALFSLDGYYMDNDIEKNDDWIIFQSHQYFSKMKTTEPDYIIIENVNDIVETKLNLLHSHINNAPLINSKIKGYMISPGAEEKIGLYDFEKLELWFEKLTE